MTFDDLIQKLDPQIYRNLRQALELGKWPDGKRLTDEQKALCMDAVIYYENQHGVSEEERVGYIDRAGKTKPCATEPKEATEPSAPGGVKYWH